MLELYMIFNLLYRIRCDLKLFLLKFNICISKSQFEKEILKNKVNFKNFVIVGCQYNKTDLLNTLYYKRKNNFFYGLDYTYSGKLKKLIFHKYILGDECKEVQFYEEKDNALLSSKYMKPNRTWRTITVEQKNINCYFRQTKIQDIFYLQIDTEGSEIEILKTLDFSSIKLSYLMIEHKIVGFDNIKNLIPNYFEIVCIDKNNVLLKNKINVETKSK
jgi:FkbM family methyltransferase